MVTAYPPQDRLIRKEVALGVIRDLLPPTGHIGTSLIAPFMEVASDDVIFEYAKGLTDGLVPARAEDAESELSQKDYPFGGIGRASILDWAEKTHYSASEVTRYQESLVVDAYLTSGQLTSLPLTVTSMVSEFQAKVARDDAMRRRKIDNRIEWLIMQAIETGGIAYNDGKIKFSVDYGRPSDQHNQFPGVSYTASPTADVSRYWSVSTADPIRDILDVQNFIWTRYGVKLKRGICSRKVLNQILNSSLFAARSGLVLTGSATASTTPVNPRYLLDGWGPTAAQQVVENATGFQFIEYDSVYRTRGIGVNTVQNHRFLDDRKIYFIPDDADLDSFDDAIGFAKTLTSPHPEGNWQSGFYEWEQATKDPWGVDRGSGIKMFPVFPHMDLTMSLQVLA